MADRKVNIIPNWIGKEAIAGSVNIPWSSLDLNQGATELGIESILVDEFNASIDDGEWDFSHAKTRVLFCNGIWCGQSPKNIYSRLKRGSPANKLKWFRGGMQNWHVLGFSTGKPP